MFGDYYAPSVNNVYYLNISEDSESQDYETRMGKAMTIADFADGRVLGLLREGVQDSPWHQDRNDGYPKLNDADNTVSGISDIVVDKSLQTHKIFNLQGHFVGTELKALPIGIYIMNGKKILVR